MTEKTLLDDEQDYNCLFEISSNQTGEVNPKYLIDNLFSKLPREINLAEVEKLTMLVSCKRDMKFRKYIELAELFSIKLDEIPEIREDVEIELRVEINEIENETCVRLWGDK